MQIELTNIKNLGTVWLWLGIITLILNFAFVGVSRWEFPYGVVYSLGFLAVGIILSSKEAGLISAVCASLIGVFAFLIQATLAYYTIAIAYAVISVILFLLVLILSYFEWGEQASYAKYATLAACTMWLLYPLTYFYQRLTLHMLLPYETIMFHGGIMLLAGVELFTFLGAVKFKGYSTVRTGLAGIAILGAVLLTAVLGWGLLLAPPI